jgi:hypothetical protein
MQKTRTRMLKQEPRNQDAKNQRKNTNEGKASNKEYKKIKNPKRLRNSKTLWIF